MHTAAMQLAGHMQAAEPFSRGGRTGRRSSGRWREKGCARRRRAGVGYVSRCRQPTGILWLSLGKKGSEAAATVGGAANTVKDGWVEGEGAPLRVVGSDGGRGVGLPGCWLDGGCLAAGRGCAAAWRRKQGLCNHEIDHFSCWSPPPPPPPLSLAAGLRSPVGSSFRRVCRRSLRRVVRGCQPAIFRLSGRRRAERASLWRRGLSVSLSSRSRWLLLLAAGATADLWWLAGGARVRAWYVLSGGRLSGSA